MKFCRYLLSRRSSSVISVLWKGRFCHVSSFNLVLLLAREVQVSAAQLLGVVAEAEGAPPLCLAGRILQLREACQRVLDFRAAAVGVTARRRVGGCGNRDVVTPVQGRFLVTRIVPAEAADGVPAQRVLCRRRTPLAGRQPARVHIELFGKDRRFRTVSALGQAVQVA